MEEENQLVVVVPVGDSRAVLSILRGLVAGLDVVRTASLTFRYSTVQYSQ